MKSELEGELEALDAAEVHLEDGQFAVRELARWPGHYVGRTHDGAPSILLSSKDHGVKAPLRLSGLDVNYSLPCRLRLGDGPSVDKMLTTVRCSSVDPGVRRYFVHLMEALLVSVGVMPSLAQIADAMHSIVAILQHLSSTARKSVAGCFGELMVIEMSADAAAAIGAWRDATDDQFDFSMGEARLDVKASGNRSRMHHFSFGQCSLPPERLGVLVSLFVESCGGGTTMLQLVQRIEQKISGYPNLALKLRRVLAETLGRDAPSALIAEFDERLARSSVRLYNLAHIPAVRPPIPVGVDQVQFRSDVSQTATAPREALIDTCPLLELLLPP
ncbi:MAG TPA: PD-(D/E)XK motif protein [Hyphomicrobium sp.]|nr:PD-(D/E)XK motif protein [Hyphomicrobium sp.]